MANDEEILSLEEREKRAEEADENRRLQALASNGGSESMKSLNARKAANDERENRGQIGMWIVTLCFVVMMGGGMAVLLLVVKQ